MKHEALFLTGFTPSAEEDKITKLLRFFGVACRTVTAGEFFARECGNHNSSAKYRLLCSSKDFWILMEDMERGAEVTQLWKERVHSAFLYPGDDFATLKKVIERLTGDAEASLRRLDRDTSEWIVSDKLPEFCGVMSGMRMPATVAPIENGHVLAPPKDKVSPIISSDQGAAFARLDLHSVPIFFSFSRHIVDLGSELRAGNFDVRDHVLSAVPIVLYIKWAFRADCWNAPEANACLIIDDPLLKPSYGCVNFQELLALMERHRFSTNIAFIPWNWRRSNPKVAALFKQKPEQYSLSIHGCDHTAAEFGGCDRDSIFWKAKKAVDRMSGHERRTGIHHERIMVFPQGVFSGVAMDVLKRSNFFAAVNTEVVSADPRPEAITISDAWDVAVMHYDAFPIFTRRYPFQGVENFAFDILLGKPCIVVIHHDFCRDHYGRLVKFINRLNKLNCSLSWRSLGDLVRRSCRQRELLPGVVEVEMYGTELRVENRSERPKRFLIRRRECDPSSIREIRNGSGPIAWSFVNGQVSFEIELGSGQSKTVRIRFHEPAGNKRNGDNLPYRLKTMLRRYLSEMRDNYVTTTKSRLADFVSR
jgi:hypothetical protein